ncbi:hypothetical protein EMIHUDRAFT_257719 [Emiliania huxleyi CCMP1516]|uniref:Glycosyl hydrolase family 13 catalytic domain-containing protein n=2 Tax=Emiliania huxleyi TaxID=2903 RepID=A0A0D3IGZ6_EMIH1|nr:hypothetical protein EMIHUDRAFT_257719 [Emiliania huxleyi CCMP1516]EOD10531.1 hypothetical protein EMIHUDRAFT_257719 [Emiliania huxleyi CCMP1516]|eukprot:XP_005762960.1 hypothetical protein EMIHUDRAFT_257719 [Emiliania huxleyi CCMP1516]
MAGFASPYDFLMRTNILADGRLRALTAGLTPLATVQFLAQLAAISQLHVEGLLTYPSMPRVLRCFAGPSGRPASRHARGSSWRPRSCCDVLRLTTVAAGTALFFIILSVALALPLLAPTYAVFGGGTPHRFDQFSFFSRLRAWHFGVRPPADEPPTVEDTRHARFPRSVAGKSLYMLMVDRFAQESHNGRRVYGCSGTDHWCGGDIRSIVERLDYIEGLGFDCVWMTPVIEQFGATRCFEPGTGATGTLIKSRPKRKKG